MAGDGWWVGANAATTDELLLRSEEQMRAQVVGTMDVVEWVGEIIVNKTRPEQMDKLLN